jgi:hypothetical protein
MLPERSIIIAQLESTEEFPIRLSEVWDWLGNKLPDPIDRDLMVARIAD